jgi:hypothetical protein
MDNSTAIIIVAGIQLVGVIAQVVTNKKYKKQEELQDDINKTIETFRQESKQGDKELKREITQQTLRSNKRWLIDFMSRAQNGEQFNMEQVKIAYETKELYNGLGGDSFVDDMWEECQKKNLF